MLGLELAAAVRDGVGMDTSVCTATVPAVLFTPQKPLARAGEELAAEHLVHVHGLTLIARNLRVAHEDLRGELDLVAQHAASGLLVIGEVKTRSCATGNGAVEGLGERQRRRIRRMTAVLLAGGTLRARRVRFDLLTVDVHRRGAGAPGTLRHVPDAW